jgi:hypothetical protein
MAKMKGMGANEMVIGLLMFFVVIAGFSTFFSTTASQYSYSSPSMSAYDNMSAVAIFANDSANTLTGTKIQTGTGNVFTMATGAWNSLLLFFRTQSIITILAATAGQQLGLPSWANVAINTLVGLMITSAIIAAVVWRWN